MKNNVALKSRKEIARELNISTRTLYTILKKTAIELPRYGLLSPKHYLPIYEHFNQDPQLIDNTL
ncbi:MAG: hypothetical protein OEY56_14300 [Cyclobacteriaceae bacterium]|nr:hypothetical protein [Cyclobacteriaceae bacterium]